MKTTIRVTINVSWEDLKDFLEERNLLESFVQNRIRYNGETPLRNDTRPESWISGVFPWGSTPEKGDFWGKINREWVCFLQQQVPDSVREEDIDYLWDGEPLHSLFSYYHNSSLQGKRYRVNDNSWNREVQGQDPKLWKNYDDTWRNLVTDPENEKRGCLILSEYPETKRIEWMIGSEILEKRFIKVLVPRTNKIQWVIFNPNWVILDN